MTDQIKVPEAVLEAFGMADCVIFTGGKPIAEQALAAALTKFCEELLKEEALEAGARIFLGAERNLSEDMDELREQLEAAIDSVVKNDA